MLSPREQDVLALLADGLRAKEIAHRLSITPKTAGVHITNIYAKLGVNCAVTAVRYAIRAGMIQP
jgi:DNA-binding NarL/FixJ family response regulator